MATSASRHSTKIINDERKVVVVGKTGCGKSTVANMIISSDSEVFTVSDTVSSETDKVTRESILFTFDKDVYNVTIFDTIGLFDTKALHNKNIMDKVQAYAQKYAPDGVNLVLFVMRKGRYTAEEKNAFDYIFERLGKKISAVSALVITHCENDDDESKQKIIHDLKTNELTREMARCMDKGIYPVGFPRTNTMKPKLKAIIQSDIEDDRFSLLELITKCSEKELIEEIASDMMEQSKSTSGPPSGTVTGSGVPRPRICPFL